MLNVKSSATTKMTASIGLTAALRAAATPLFNQGFYAEFRKIHKRHVRPWIRKQRQPEMQMTDADERM